MDQTTIDIPAGVAPLVTKALTSGEKFLNLPSINRTIAVHQVLSFDETSRTDTTGKKLLEGGLNAFAGEVKHYTSKDGYDLIPAIKVKKEVGQKDFNNYYGKHPSYRKTKDQGFWVSFYVAKDLGIPDGCTLA